VNLEAELFSATEVSLNCVGSIAGEDNDIGEAVLPRQIDLVFQERFSADGNHGFGQIAEAISQTRALSTGQDDKLFHALGSLNR
jgi:hypothetical protein